jgi:hypothetical protein
MVAGIYFAFGFAYMLLAIYYCEFRAAAGNPSDLPCNALLWNTIAVLGWPMAALGDVIQGSAIFVPSIVVRAVGFAFLGGFVAALALLVRGLRRRWS